MDCREMIVSEDFISLIMDFRIPEEALEKAGIEHCYVQIESDLYILYLDRRRLGEFSAANFSYRYAPQLYGLEAIRATERPGGSLARPAARPPFDPQPLTVSGILALQRPPLSLTGQGVVIGIIDTGISYENPVFRFSDGTSRILAIWDQTDQSGRPPAGFLYGTEYTKEQINQALQSEEPHSLVPQQDENGHGTAIASVAAGSRIEEGTAFLGAAPDAMLVVIKLKPAKQFLRDYYLVAEDVPAYGTDDLIQAVRYLEKFTIPFRRPTVFMLGMGTSLGSHNGGSIFTEYLDRVAARYSQVLVIGGGNQGNTAGHFRAPLTGEMRQVEIRVGENTGGFLAELWGMQPATMRVSLRSPGGEVIPEVDFRLNRLVDYTFVYEKTRVTFYYAPMERNTGDQLIVLRFEAPAPGIWTLYVRGIRTVPDGQFDLWLSPQQFIQGEAYFLQSTPEVTLTMPAYVQDAVSVTVYNSENGSFYYNSGQGFSRLREIKPDLAAPGVQVSTALGPYTGSGMATAVTAGAVAQLLQWTVTEQNQDYLSSREIKGMLSRGARQLPGQTYPNRQWGYGMLDLEATFDEIAGRSQNR